MDELTALIGDTVLPHEEPYAPNIVVNGSNIGVLINYTITQPATFIKLLQVLQCGKKGQTIRIDIESPGGNLFSGLMIYEAIKACEAKVITNVLQCAASAAALIWSAGDERLMCDSAYILYHTASHFTYGKTRDIKDSMEWTENLLKKEYQSFVDQGIFTQEDFTDIVERRLDVSFVMGPNNQLARIDKLGVSPDGSN
mgnify:CR=1 FL=1